MVRLMLTLTPVVCILAAIAFSVTLDNYLVDDRPSENKDATAKPTDGNSSSEENDKKRKKDLYDKVKFLCKKSSEADLDFWLEALQPGFLALLPFFSQWEILHVG